MAANPSNFQITPLGTLMENQEFNLRSLYLHHTPAGPKPNQSALTNKNDVTGLGPMIVNNWAIYDGVGPDAMVVARAQGLHINAGKWHNSFSLVFENERFKGSTLEVMGTVVEEGEWAIVGGTGQFAMATGVIYKKFQEQRSEGNIIELTVHGFCRLFTGSKERLHTSLSYACRAFSPRLDRGVEMGAAQDIIEAPKCLESITVRSGTVVDSIAFFYIDQAGQRRTTGPWGGDGGYSHTIQLGSSEVVKEVCGAVGTYDGYNVISSIKVVTNEKTHGPFGYGNGTPFNVPVQGNSAVVGFFGRSGKYLDALGIYVHPF